MVITNRTPDWPRNINFALAGTGVGMAGTLDVNGRDQFGASQSESLGFGSADNGGTVVGSGFSQKLQAEPYDTEQL